MNRKTDGFTLIEVLVVLFILMSLAGIVSVNVLRHQSEARVSTATLQIRQFQQALQQYRAEQGRLPTQEQGLLALVQKPGISPIPPRYPEEGYLMSRHLPKDPWNNDYVYLFPGRDGQPFEVVCFGSDGALGGDGDAADISTADF